MDNRKNIRELSTVEIEQVSGGLHPAIPVAAGAAAGAISGYNSGGARGALIGAGVGAISGAYGVAAAAASATRNFGLAAANTARSIIWGGGGGSLTSHY